MPVPGGGHRRKAVRPPRLHVDTVAPIFDGHLGVAGLSAAVVRRARSLASAMPGILLIGALTVMSLVGVSAILWIAVQLASWWVDVSYLPVGAGSSQLERLLR